MQITLTPEVEALLEQKLQTGNYRDANEVLMTALNVLSVKSSEDLSRLDAFIQEGLDDIDHGDVFTEDEARAYLKAVRAKL